MLCGLTSVIRGTAPKPTQSAAPAPIEGVKVQQARRPSMDHIKRASMTSFADLGVKHRKRKSMLKPESSLKFGWIDVKVESPPLLLLGERSDSSGALFSGVTRLNITEPSIVIEEWSVRLVLEMTSKRPAQKDCAECTTKREEIKRWDFAHEPLTLRHGDHLHPLSYLLRGDIPATTHGMLGGIKYHLHAIARTSSGDTISHHQNIEIRRALQVSETPHRSLRVFPPTRLQLEASYPHVIHPIGDFTIYMRMDHCTSKRENNLMRWKIQKCRWWIDEEMRVISPPCDRHGHIRPAGVVHHDARELGGGEVGAQWKYDTTQQQGDGAAEVEFQAHINPASKPTCDVDYNGTTVEHKMGVEIVIREEFAINKKQDQFAPTGHARVLRAKFGVRLSDRRGQGIAWDEEQPPTYEDVPHSPPGYVPASPPDYEDMEILDAAI